MKDPTEKEIERLTQKLEAHWHALVEIKYQLAGWNGSHMREAQAFLDSACKLIDDASDCIDAGPVNE